MHKRLLFLVDKFSNFYYTLARYLLTIKINGTIFFICFPLPLFLRDHMRRLQSPRPCDPLQSAELPQPSKAAGDQACISWNSAAPLPLLPRWEADAWCWRGKPATSLCRRRPLKPFQYFQRHCRFAQLRRWVYLEENCATHLRRKNSIKS